MNKEQQSAFLSCETGRANMGKDAPRYIHQCLCALGVQFRRGSFWQANEGELEWLLKDAHVNWRRKRKQAHEDHRGTHLDATRLNLIWDRTKKLFRKRGVILAVLLCGCLNAFADGPDLNQHVWRSNGLIYASADIPACHVARWERVVVLGTNAPFTNALSAMTVDEEVFTRRVVFSESLSNFPMAFYRIHILRVFTCADFTVWTHACL